MSALEQELVEKISHLSEAQQQKVLAFIENLETAPNTALDLMKLPAEERARLVAEAFALAANEDFEIFEAYTEEEVDESV